MQQSVIEALRRDQVIKRWPRTSNFVLTDLRTGLKFNCRGGSPIGSDHSDFQYLAVDDWQKVTNMAGRSWKARPAILETPNRMVTVVSYHTYNHSVRVTEGAFDIVEGEITRENELDYLGNWVPGHHMCMHYIDSWVMRADTQYTRDMRRAVEDGIILANADTFTEIEFLLQLGDSNEYVRTLKEGINQLGYRPELHVDNSFGASTDAGIRWVQERYGLEITGVVNHGLFRLITSREGEPLIIVH